MKAISTNSLFVFFSVKIESYFGSFLKLFLFVNFLFYSNVIFSQSIFSNTITDPNPSNYNPFVLGQITDANLLVTGIGRGSGMTPNVGADRYNCSNLNSTSRDTSDYFSFTLIPNAGFQLNLTSFVYTSQKSATGPLNFSFRSSLNGFSTDIPTSLGTGATISLSAVAYQNITTPVEFRFYCWNASSAAGTFSINDFTFNGAVVSLPRLSATSITSFGSVCVGVVAGANTFVVSGINLTSDSIKVGPLNCYTFSLDNNIFSNSIGFVLASNQTQTIYVRFTPTAITNYNGNIIVTGGGASAIYVPVIGVGLGTRPSFTNGVVSNISTSSANISVQINSTGCSAITAYGIEYSLSPGFIEGSGTMVQGTNLSGNNFSVLLSGLSAPGQTYYFYTYVINVGGIKYGLANSFTLLSNFPVLSVPANGAGSVGAFTNICINTNSTINTFSLTGSVLDGTNISIGPLANFTFSTTTAGPYSNTINLVNGGVGYNYSSGSLTNCNIHTKFTPTAVQSYSGVIPITGGGASALNLSVTASGVDNTPGVVTSNAIFITTTSAILQGSIQSAGCSVLLEYGIEYSISPGFVPGTGTRISSYNLSNGNFSISANGLNPNTVYYFVAFASNMGGTSFGIQKNFITSAVPTKLVITAITPSSPIALTPFSITITAVDDLINLTPLNVSENTAITLLQTAGVNILTFPSSPVGIIPAGSNSITIPGNFYDVPENGIAVTATATSGMVSLGTSAPFVFNVIAYTGPSNFIWSANGNSAWLTGTNWQNGTSPGSSLSNNHHMASFTSLAGLSNSALGGCGLNMNSVGADYSLGTINFENTYATNHTSDVVPIGNSSTATSGVLSLNGSVVNNLAGIAGNNYSDLFISNYMSGATTKTLEIRNSIGSGSKYLTLNLATPGTIVATPGNKINLNVLLTGSQSLTFTGGGTLLLNPYGAAASNYFSGPIIIANGNLIAGNSGAFNLTTPNSLTLGSSPSKNGTLNLNGNNITIGGLTTAGSAGILNTVINGTVSATLNINNNSSCIFGGALNNGTSGTLSLIKNGTGAVTLTGLNQFTGFTTLNNGSLILNNASGGTIPSGNSIIVNGGLIRISSDQTIKDFTLNGGMLQVDTGVTLTITGIFSAGAAFITNNGTIKLSGSSMQTFPGLSVTVNAMNNLFIANNSGVELNQNLNVLGVLTLANGIFSVTDKTLTINNPIAGNPGNMSANNTSSIVIAGTAANVNLPASINYLSNLSVSNTQGTTLLNNLNIAGTMLITASAGIINAGYNITLNGIGNLVMTGGNLRLGKNAVTLPEFSGIYNLTGGTITFDGVGIGTDAQTVRPVNYFNLASSPTGGNRILSNTGTIAVNNIFTPSTNSYVINGSTVEFNKTSNQVIPAFDFYNLRITGGASTTKTLTGNVSVKSKLTLGAGAKLSLDNFNVTLKSDSLITANVDYIPTSNSFIYNGTGRFIVERFIPTSLTHAKTWQFLSTPASGSSLRDSWQEGNAPLANLVPLYGTTICSERSGAVSRGYDFYTPTGATIKTFNSTTNIWNGIDDGISNTSSVPIANKKGYMIFIRGDRSVQSSSALPTITTLRTRGKLFSRGTDAPPSVTVDAGKLESVGNPYASAIDFANLISTSANIDSKYYVWDPLLPGTSGYGAFQTITSATGFKPTPGGTANYSINNAYTKIQSGQAFFVYSTAGGVVNFNETNKTSGSANAFRQTNSNAMPAFRLKLSTGTGRLTDGNTVVFSADFENGFESNDAIKLSNFGENISIKNNDKLLAVDARNQLINQDTIFYNFNNLRIQQYQFEFIPENFNDLGLQAFLIDKYLLTSTDISISTTTNINFNITSDPASNVSDRFYVIFKPAVTVPVHSIEISSSYNHVIKSVDVKWDIRNEIEISRYNLEKSIDGINFTCLANIAPSNNNGANPTYIFNDNNPMAGFNYYRVKCISIDGREQLSSVTKVNVLPSGSFVRVNPNPASNRQINLEIVGLEAGNYKVTLVNNSGQKLYASDIRLIHNIEYKSLVISNEIPVGCYWLLIKNYRIPVLIQ